jgi:hypothetical protein
VSDPAPENPHRHDSPSCSSLNGSAHCAQAMTPLVQLLQQPPAAAALAAANLLRQQALASTTTTLGGEEVRRRMMREALTMAVWMRRPWLDAALELLFASGGVCVRERGAGGLTREVERALAFEPPRCDQLMPLQLNEYPTGYSCTALCVLAATAGGTATKKVRNRNAGFRVGDRSRGHYATPADFLQHDGTGTWGYTYDAGAWDSSIVQGPFSVAPCPNPNRPHSHPLFRSAEGGRQHEHAPMIFVRIEMFCSARRDRKSLLNCGQIPNPDVVRVVPSTGYRRV